MVAVCTGTLVSSKTKACLFIQGYGSDGLKLISHEESISFGDSVLKLTFDPGTVGDLLLTVECRLDHPFYVKNKGKVFSLVLDIINAFITCDTMRNIVLQCISVIQSKFPFFS